MSISTPTIDAFRPNLTEASEERPLHWLISQASVAYPNAIAQLNTWAAEVADGTGPERIWLLQHPALYTAGTSADPHHLLTPDRFPVFETGRGGEYTYHGPGQRIVYVVLDIRKRFDGNVRLFVDALENWLVTALSCLAITAHPGQGARGVWAAAPTPELKPKKIASIGIRIRRGVSLHGMSVNVAPDLEHFSGIIACGGAGEAQTSIVDLTNEVTMADLDRALYETFESATDLAALRGSCASRARDRGL